MSTLRDFCSTAASHTLAAAVGAGAVLLAKHVCASDAGSVDASARAGGATGECGDDLACVSSGTSKSSADGQVGGGAGGKSAPATSEGAPGVAAAEAATLSARGRKFTEPMIDYLEPLLAAWSDLYDPSTNPEGHVVACVAENKLATDVLCKRLNRTAGANGFATGYGPLQGLPALQQAAAHYINRLVLREGSGATVNPEDVLCSAGVAGFLQTLPMVLCEPGDVVISPGPHYAAFQADITRCSGATLAKPTMMPPDFRYSRALFDAGATSGRVRMLLLTNPENPMGIIHSRAEIEIALQWCFDHNVHLVSDEIYANCVFGDNIFVSVLDVAADKFGPSHPFVRSHVHALFGLSKDLGASGLRVGFLVTRNKALNAALAGCLVGHCVSGDTSLRVAEMLQDDEWVDGFMKVALGHLKTGYDAVTSLLSRAGVPYVHAQAGMFVWVDFSEFLSEPTKDAEDVLHRRLTREAKMVLTPGSCMHPDKPGWFRICTAWHDPEIMISRLQAVLEILRGAKAT